MIELKQEIELIKHGHKLVMGINSSFVAMIFIFSHVMCGAPYFRKLLYLGNQG